MEHYRQGGLAASSSVGPVMFAVEMVIVYFDVGVNVVDGVS